jgi:hypothetical protein
MVDTHKPPKGYAGFSSSFDKSIKMMGGKRPFLPFICS